MVGLRNALLASVTVVVLFACGEDTETTSNASVTRRIGPEGGEIILPDGAGVTIPPGALDEEVVITVARLPATDAEELIGLFPSGLTSVSELYAFTPHGLEFLLPVEVTVPYDSTSNELAMQNLDDEDDRTWSEDEGATFEDGVATLETDHFSIKGVTSGTVSMGTDAGEDAAMTVADSGTPPKDSGSQQTQDSGTDAAADEDAGSDTDSGTDSGTISDVLVRFTAGDGTTTITGELPGTPFGIEDNRPSDIFQGDVIFPLSDGTEIVVTFCDGAYLVTDGCGVNAIPNLPAGTYQVFMRGEFYSALGTILTTNSLPFTITDSGSNEWIVQLSNTNLTMGGAVDVYGVNEIGPGSYKAIFTPSGGGGSTMVNCTHVATGTGHCTFMVPSVSAGMYNVTIIAGTGGDAVTSDVNPVVVN